MPAIATVNGEPLASATIDAYANATTGHAYDDLSPPDQETVLRSVARLAAASQAATKEGIDKEPRVMAELELQRMQLLQSRLVKRHLPREIPEEELRREYQAQLAASSADAYRVSHILLPTEEAARAALDELKRGAQFADVAKRLSQDTSRQQGGDLGWVDFARLPKPFVDAVRTLRAGQRFDQPVHTDYGWHVIAVTETRPAPAPEFAAVRAQLEVAVRERREREFLDQVFAAAKVDRLNPQR